jgi:hypothetical protein
MLIFPMAMNLYLVWLGRSLFNKDLFLLFDLIGCVYNPDNFMFSILRNYCGNFLDFHNSEEGVQS